MIGTIGSFLVVISVTLMFVSCVMLIKNHIVYRCRVKMLDISFDNYKKNHRAFAKYESRSYNEMLWDFTCWTFKSFYGDIDELKRGV